MRTWVERIGTNSFTLTEEAWQGGRLCAKGTATYVYFNYQTGQSEPVPDNCRHELEAHLRSL